MLHTCLPLLLALAADNGCALECEDGSVCPEPCPAYASACDLAYGPRPWQTLDLYLPHGWNPDTSTLPLVFYVHGGAWKNGDKRCSVVLPFVEALLGRGYPVVSINYELADPVENPGTWPQPILDLKRALAWVRTVGAQAPYELPTCVVAVGTSAGAHLVALQGASWEVDELQPFAPAPPDLFRPDLVVLFSGPTDFFSMGCQGWCLDASCSACPAGAGCFDFDGPGMDTPVEAWLGCIWGAQTFGGPPGAAPPQLRGCRAASCSNPPSLPLIELSGDPFLDASPRTWVDAQDPAVFHFGALCDAAVPPEQLTDYHDALVAVGVDSMVWLESTLPTACLHAFGIYGPAGTADMTDVVISQWWPHQASYGTGSFCR